MVIDGIRSRGVSRAILVLAACWSLAGCSGTVTDRGSSGALPPVSGGAGSLAGQPSTPAGTGGIAGGTATLPGGGAAVVGGAGGVGSGPGPTACDAAPAPLGKPRVWRLTISQVGNTLQDSFGFVPPSLNSLPKEARLDGFANQASKLTISPLLAETYFAVGAELGAHAAANPAKFGIKCDVAQLAAGDCLNGFISTAGQKMWRRPLVESELSKLSSLFTATAANGGSAAAVGSVIQAMFMSPSFLHRTELGSSAQAGAVIQLTDHELASALSYLLWDTAPDAELLSLAADSKLRDRSVLLAQAKRLFEAREKSEPAMNSFFRQWLFLENLATSVKTTSIFPLGTPEVAQDLSEELRLFTNSILFDPGADRSFRTLFTAGYTFVNARTAPLYGIAGVTSNDFVRRDLDPAQRRGVISLAPFLWGHANAEATALVHRGAYFRRHVLCHRVALPAGGVPPGSFAPPNSTGRQKLTVHSSPPCAGCHALFDGIGFAMENYDAIGQWRTTEYDQPIDASGTLPLPSEGNQAPGLAFSNFVELIDQLANKPDVYSCFAQQFASYASGRDIPEMDECERNAIVTRFVGSNYKIDDLVMSVISSPSFVERRN
jgi:hypothetical protein